MFITVFVPSSPNCCQLGALGRAQPRVPQAPHMAPARRPSSSPARLQPSPRALGGVLQGPGCDELLLIAKTLGLPPLAQPSSSAELVAQIILAANEGKLRRPIREGRGASLCTALVHTAFRLIDPNKGGAPWSHFGTL